MLLAEDLAIGKGGFLRALLVVVEEFRRDFAPETCGERNETLRVFLEIGFRNARSVVKTLDIALRRDLLEILKSLVRLGE